MNYSTAILLGYLAIAATAFSTDEASSQTVNAQIAYPEASQQSFKGPDPYFTGNVQVNMLFPANETAHYSGAYVTFQPGARTAWHLHPAGQHMIVTDGVCRTGTRDGKIIEFTAGETVWCPADTDHWHGATPDRAMTHLVITGAKDGENVTWKEKVTDAQYLGNTQTTSEETAMNTTAQLSKKQEAIIPIASFTASGDLEQLKGAFHDGLDAGLTINEIKEIPIHLYAYAGFPRALNGLGTLMAVLEERKAQGITDAIGRDASPLPADKSSLELGEAVQTRLVGQPVTGALYDFAPAVDVFLKSHLFGDLFGRDVLDYQEREIATVSALSSMDGVEPQLNAHFVLSMNTGVTEAQLEELLSILEAKADKTRSLRAKTLLQYLLQARADNL